MRRIDRAAIRAHRRAAALQRLREATRYWKLVVTRGGCVMCAAYPMDANTARDYRQELRRVEGHHVIAKRDLKAHGLHEHLWDERNGLALCAYHHARHENWRQRVPRRLLPPAAHDFAAELGLEWLLEREYPEAP